MGWDAAARVASPARRLSLRLESAAYCHPGLDGLGSAFGQPRGRRLALTTDKNEIKPGRAPGKDKAALSSALRENLRRRKAHERASSSENTREQNAPARQQAPEGETKWTK